MKYQNLCEQIIKYAGGKENIADAFHCVSRLRLTLADQSKLDVENMNKVDGIIKVNQFKDQIQLIIGNHVGEVYEDFIAMTGLQAHGQVDEDTDEEEKAVKKSLWATFTEAISSIMMPLSTAMVGFGILKGLTMLLEFLKVLDKKGATYTFFYNIGDSVIYFIPVITAYSAARYFKTNVMISITMACALFNPKLTALVATEGGAKIFDFLTIGNVSYASTVVPILLMVWLQSYIEKGLKKIMPKMVQKIFVPVLTVFFVMIAMYVVIGPVGVVIGNTLANVYTAIYNVAPPVAGALIGGLWSLLVSWGMHTILVPIVMNNIAVLGYDTLMAFASCGNFGQIGGLLATFFKTKDSETKENAAGLIASAAMSGFGLTEPVIYGNNLGLKSPFYCGLIGGAVGGLVCSFLQVKAISVGAFSLYKFAVYAGSLTGIIVSVVISTAVAFALTYIKGVDKKEN